MARAETHKCFAARSRDVATLLYSSSGGVFAELAASVVSRRGMAVGAGWDAESCRVVHVCVEDAGDVRRICGTKYVQSRIGADVWRRMRSALADGRAVLFSGTPCQTAAARKLLGDARGLILCSLICHSNVSARIWERYVREIEDDTGSRLKSVRFRDKRHGWEKSTMAFEFEDSSRDFHRSFYADPYGKAYLRGYSASGSCLDCRFKMEKSGADFIIGDFWGGGQIIREWNDGKGISAIAVLNESALSLLENCNLDLRPAEYAAILKNNPYIETSIKPDLRKRARFQSAYCGIGVGRALFYAEFGPFPGCVVSVLRHWLKCAAAFCRRVARAASRSLVRLRRFF